MTQEQAAWCNMNKEALETRDRNWPEHWKHDGIFFASLGHIVPAQDVLDLFQRRIPPDR